MVTYARSQTCTEWDSKKDFFEYIMNKKDTEVKKLAEYIEVLLPSDALQSCCGQCPVMQSRAVVINQTCSLASFGFTAQCRHVHDVRLVSLPCTPNIALPVRMYNPATLVLQGTQCCCAADS